MTYSLTDDSSGRFAIDSLGVVTVANGSLIDYETSGGSYSITVQASDGTANIEQSFSITVTDVAPSTPTDDDPGTPDSVVEGAAIGTTVGVTALASDPAGGDVTYSITADTSGGGFTVDPTTGVVSVADDTLIDFESSGGSYDITVEASVTGGTLTASQMFTIAVTDAAPSTLSDSDAAGDTVEEGAAIGTTVGVIASASDPSGGAVTYSLTADTSGGGFTVDPTTGVVTVLDGSLIDFESAVGGSYDITVEASVTGSALTSSQTFSIAVTNAAPSIPTDDDPADNSVVEGAANGTTVGVTALATDPAGPPVTYSITGDTSLGGFQIDPDSGVVTVLDGSLLDHAISASHSIAVQASDGSLTSEQTFTISVENVAPDAPIDTDAADNTVAEDAADGTTVGITAFAPHPGVVTYSLTDDSSGRFTIDSMTGVVTVLDGSLIDYESSGGSYSIAVEATDGVETSSQSFSITVTDVAPTTPTDSDAADNSVAEGAANGTAVHITGFASDPSGGTVTYSLSDSAGGRFAIDPSTGVVTVANGSLVDYESAVGHSYDITVLASVTGGTLTASQTFSIAVTDVGPTTPTDSNVAANSVAEGAANGTTVGITATASDPAGAIVTYSLTDSAGGRFTVDPSTGVVKVANGSLIDYETAVGHSYNITVLATVGTASASEIFSIAVTNAAPSIPADSDSADNSVAEAAANGTAVGVTALSTDPAGGDVTYSLTDNAGGRFAIGSSSGVVTVLNGSLLDHADSASHSITVQASDGSLTSLQTFTISVENVNPDVPVDNDPADNTVVEDAANGTAVGITAFAPHPGTVTYSLTADTSGGGFTIDSTTGIVTVLNGSLVDYESSGGSYSITVEATDGAATSSQSFSIAVTNLAPATPTDGNVATNTVAEGAANGTAIGVTASATDPAGGTLTYSLSDSAGGRFAIDPSTGVVTVANGAQVDFESSGGSYSITVQASDGSLPSTQSFNIAVTNAAPSTPVDANAATNSVAEGVANGTAVGVTASASDPAGGAVTYSLTDSAGGRFAIDASTGVVTVLDGSLIDFAASGGSYSITVQASDGALTSSQSFTINVQTPLTANERFVTNVYHDLLGRVVEASGLAHWTSKLAGGESRTQVVLEIEQTLEFKHVAIEQLYNRYLSRAADPVGLQSFTVLLNLGASIEDIAALIVGSPEYFALQGGTNDGFLHGLYQDTFGRGIDAGGLAWWTAKLASGETRAQVAHEIFMTDEYYQGVVEYGYGALLSRAPDTDGMTAWVNALKTGASDQQVFAAIAASDEYYNKM